MSPRPHPMSSPDIHLMLMGRKPADNSRFRPINRGTR
jgi:hypothetical protein